MATLDEQIASNQSAIEAAELAQRSEHSDASITMARIEHLYKERERLAQLKHQTYTGPGGGLIR